jgi:hypothetical protein
MDARGGAARATAAVEGGEHGAVRAPGPPCLRALPYHGGGHGQQEADRDGLEARRPHARMHDGRKPPQVAGEHWRDGRPLVVQMLLIITAALTHTAAPGFEHQVFVARCSAGEKQAADYSMVCQLGRCTATQTKAQSNAL